jgi:outer membrane receptor protein involved in Fe transport
VQLAPVTQEELIAYEVGFKAPLFDRSARLNGALFYYDYKDKQLTGTYTDPLFGQLNSLVNIPRSTVQGAELELAWTPVEGLSIAASAAYVETEIDRSPDGTDFTNFTQFGAVQSFTGTPFPFSPELQLNATADYQFGINERFNGFVGGSVAYRSETQSSLGRDERLAIDAYTLVDLRAGVSDPDGRWKLSVFGRNVFDEHYWNNFISAQDTNIRYAGRPAEYGVSLSYDF